MTELFSPLKYFESSYRMPRKSCKSFLQPVLRHCSLYTCAQKRHLTISASGQLRATVTLNGTDFLKSITIMANCWHFLCHICTAETNRCTPWATKTFQLSFEEYGSLKIPKEFLETNWKRKGLDTWLKKNSGNRKHRLKTREQHTKARAYWREHDRRGWTGRPTKPGRPDTNTSLNTPDIHQRDVSNTV